MKISATIEVFNRKNASIPGIVRNRPVQSTLSIGKVSRDGEYKILYCNKSMPTPRMYNIIDNIQKVYIKFVSEGKTTISFRVPQIDLMISGVETKTLSSFLQILAKVLKNEPINTTHVIDLHDTKVPSKAKTSLKVENKNEYWQQFPRTLTTLLVSQIDLDDIGNKMRPLLQLNILDLSQNILTELPEYLGNLPISELNLSHNQLTYQSNWSWLKKPCIQKTLTKLILSNNKLAKLPTALYKFQNLVELDIASVNIVTIPTWVCSSFPKIRKIDLSYNAVVYAPANFKDLKRIESLQEPQIEIYDADERFPVTSVPRDFPSLKSLAAKHVYPYRFQLSPKFCPESLILYLHNNVGYCKCGKSVFGEDSHPLSGHFKRENFWNMFDNPERFVCIFGDTSHICVLYQECLNKTKRCS